MRNSAVKFLNILRHRFSSREARAFLFLAVLALVLRVGALGSLPAGFSVEELKVAYQALHIVQEGEWQFAYPAVRDTGLALYLWIEAVFIGLFGSSAFTARLPAALAGTAAAVLTALVAFELNHDRPRRQRMTLLTLFLMAVSVWPLILSRGVSAAIMLPAFEAGCIYLLLRAVRTGERRLSAAAGLVFGLGLVMYVSFVWFVLLPLLFFAGLRRRQRAAAHLHTCAFLAGAAPLLLLAAMPGTLALRAPQVGLEGLPDYITTLLASLFVSGDAHYRYSLSGQRVLDFLPALGVVVAIGMEFFIRQDDQRRPPMQLLFVWLVIALLPAISVPVVFSLRETAGAIAPFCIIASAGLGFVYEAAERCLGRLRSHAGRLAIMVLFLQAAVSLSHYYDWADSSVTRSRHLAAMTRNMEAVRESARQGPLYLVLPGRPEEDFTRLDPRLTYLFYRDRVTRPEHLKNLAYHMINIADLKSLPPGCTRPACRVVIFKDAEGAITPLEMRMLLGMTQNAGMKLERAPDLLIFSY